MVNFDTHQINLATESFKNFFIRLVLLGTSLLFMQGSNGPKTAFDHPSIQKIDALVKQHHFKEAISLSLQQATKMKKTADWEGYIAFMVRAAEIETFEVWKARSIPGSNISVDYNRPFAYLDSLYKNAGKYIETYPYLEARALFTNAVVYDWLVLPDSAEQMHIKALELKKKVFGLESREVADSYLWMGVIYNWGLRRNDAAKYYYLKAQELQKKYMPESRYALGSTYYGLAIMARQNFEFDEAEAMARQYSNLYADLPFEQASACLVFANIYGAKGEFDKALEQRLKAISIYKASGLNDDLVVGYSSYASDLLTVKRYSEAREMLKKGLAILKRFNISSYYQIRLYETFGELHQVTNQYDSAEFYFNEAIKLCVDMYGGKNAEVANAYVYRGNLFLAKKDFPSALEAYQQMLMAVVPGFHPENIFSVPKAQNDNPYYLTIVEGNFDKADAFFEWYRLEKNPAYLEKALENYNAAYDQLMVARGTVGDELSKPFLMDNYNTSIEKSIQCAAMIYEKTRQKDYFEAFFQFVEINKYLNVLDALQRSERANNSGIPKNLLVELQNIKSQIQSYQKAIIAEKNPTDSIAKYQEIVVDLVNKRRALMSELSAYPDFLAENLTSMLLTVDEIQRQLSEDEQILEFYWGNDSIYAISITKNTTAIQSTPHTDQTDSITLEAYKMMSGTPSLDKQGVKNYSEVTLKIYDTFYGPMIVKKKVRIIPDGPLSLLSAEALVVDAAREKVSYSELDYLIYHHEVSYAYSSSILFKNSRPALKAIENVLAFSYSSGGESPQFVNRGGQTELPGTYKELEALTHLFKNVNQFVDKNASKRNFLSHISGNDIVHLGVHGIGDQEVADNSRLIFKNDSLNDFELYAYEIYNLKLDARLVVLSACESGIGRRQSGEGMFSIARAFTYAGCPSLVMSLWQARDAFTSDIMISFYENLHQNEPISTSLRSAKLKFLRESESYTAHPSNWAPFVLNGQDIVFDEKSGLGYPVYAILPAILLTIGAAFYFWRRTR